MRAVRQRCADGEVQARADYLSRIASGRAASPSGGQRQQQQGQSSPSLEGVPEVVAARCGHKALMLHHRNALSTQRLLRRQQVLSLCQYCGHDLSGTPAVPLAGRALRSARKHLRCRKRRRAVLLRAARKTCALCGRTTVFKTFREEEKRRGGSGSGFGGV